MGAAGSINPCGTGGIPTNYGSVNNQSISANATGGGQSHDHTLSANFSGYANSVLQPYLVLIYIIKT